MYHKEIVSDESYRVLDLNYQEVAAYLPTKHLTANHCLSNAYYLGGFTKLEHHKNLVTETAILDNSPSPYSYSPSNIII